MDNSNSRTENDSIIEAMQELHAFDTIGVQHPNNADLSAKVGIMPDGKKLVSLKPFLDEYRTSPERRKGTAAVRDAGSLIDLANRFKSKDSAVFAMPDTQKPTVTAVLDYHPEGADPEDAAFGTHRVRYDCPLAEEWKIWHAANGQPMTQAVFAEFLEDRITDVVIGNQEYSASLDEYLRMIGGRIASPSQLLELSRGLAVNVETSVRDATVLQTGEIDIKYTETHKDGAGEPIKVPNCFLIAIPVFYAGPTYQIPVRLRYRLAGQRMTWICQLARPDRVFDDAFDAIVTRVKLGTELPVFLGAPEA